MTAFLLLTAVLLVISVPAAGQAPRWTVDPQPVVRLGVGELLGHDFHQIRGAVRLEDGTIVVADGSSRELRFFSPSGSLVRVVGRRGGGPGEFEDMVSSLGRMSGDTLVVVCRAHRRITRFLDTGELVDTRPLPDSEFNERPSYSVKPNGVITADMAPFVEPRRGMNRRESLMVTLNPGTLKVDTLGTFGGIEHLMAPGERNWHTLRRPYGQETISASGQGGVFFVGDTGERAIQVMTRGTRGYQATGRIAIPDPPRPVTAAHRRAVLDRLEGTSSGATALRAIGDLQFPRHLPAFRDMRTDRSGLLWVQAYPELGQSNAKWWVFEPSGTMQGILENPPEGRILEIGDSHILTTRRRAEDDTEVIELYTLRRGGRS
jgi:hypothetical protein